LKESRRAFPIFFSNFIPFVNNKLKTKKRYNKNIRKSCRIIYAQFGAAAALA
jgi:hypothetical protein